MVLETSKAIHLLIFPEANIFPFSSILILAKANTKCTISMRSLVYIREAWIFSVSNDSWANLVTIIRKSWVRLLVTSMPDLIYKTIYFWLSVNINKVTSRLISALSVQKVSLTSPQVFRLALMVYFVNLVIFLNFYKIFRRWRAHEVDHWVFILFLLNFINNLKPLKLGIGEKPWSKN